METERSDKTFLYWKDGTDMLDFFQSTKLQYNADGLVTNRHIHEGDFLLLWEIFQEKLPSDQTWLIGNQDGNREYIPCFSLEELRKERLFEDVEVFRLMHRILTGLKLLHNIGHFHGALHLRNIFWNPQTDHLYVVDPILEAQIQQNIQNSYGWTGDIKMLGSSMASLQTTLQPMSLHDLDHLHLPLASFLSKMIVGVQYMKHAEQTLKSLDEMLCYLGNLYQKIQNSSSLQVLESFSRIQHVHQLYKPYRVFATAKDDQNNQEKVQFMDSIQWKIEDQIEEQSEDQSEDQSETMDSSNGRFWKELQQKDVLLVSTDCFRHLLRGIESQIQWSRKQKKHVSSEILRRNQSLAEDIFVQHRGKEKLARQEALSLWTTLLNKWSEKNQSATLFDDEMKKESDIRTDLLSFSWMMLKKSIGESGYWRPPFTIEGQLCEMLLQGERNLLTIKNYKEALKYQRKYIDIQTKIEGFQQCILSAERVVEVQKEVHQFHQQSWFQKLKSSEISREKKIIAQEKLVLSNRNRLLKKWAPSFRSVLDAEVIVPMLKEIEMEQKKIQDDFENVWFLPLQMSVKTSEEQNQKAKDQMPCKELEKIQVSIENHKISFRWIPSNGYIGGVWVLTTPVTQGVYKIIMRENPSRFINDQAPVEMVSYWESIQFCTKLAEYLSVPCGFSFPDASQSKTEKVEEISSRRRGRVSLFSEPKGREKDTLQINESTSIQLHHEGIRLLSLDEWLYVARCNRKFAFSGSNFSHRVAWTRENAQQTQNVRRLYPNGWGLYDMSGNVDEWCWPDARYRDIDVNQEPFISEQEQRYMQSSDVFLQNCKQVQRGAKPRCGGSWYGDSNSSIISYEQVQWGEPHIYADTIGFRIAFMGKNFPNYLKT